MYIFLCRIVRWNLFHWEAGQILKQVSFSNEIISQRLILVDKFADPKLNDGAIHVVLFICF